MVAVMDERASHRIRDHRLSGAPDTWPFSASDAAFAAGVSERTIRRAIARGDLPATKHAGIYRIAAADLERFRLRMTARRVPRTNPASGGIALPARTSSLIGRETERATIRELLLRDGMRLVTLTGPGGVGKTRLAVEIAREVADVFEDGARFVDLSPIRDPQLVLPTIAQAIGFQNAGRRSLNEAIAAFLQPRDVLLLLDNCEQVIEAAPEIADLIGACPNLHVVATSRAPLRIEDEHRFPLNPLPLPASAEAPAKILTQSDAIRLFIERTGAISPDSFSTEDVRSIATICRRLDGLPLAIVLAAAWSAVLTPSELLARLTESMRRPGQGPRDLPQRQRTVWDTIAWSHDLLPPDAQTVFRRLAVFVGGFDLDAAATVADVPAEGAIDLIGVLVEHSLVRRVETAAGGARFAMLETMREYAAELLDAHGETDEARSRHAEHYLLFAEHTESVLYGSRMRQHLDCLETEHPNCLGALGYFVETGDATRELRLAGMLSEYWYYRGRVAEGIVALGAALERGSASPPGARARVMSELCFLYWVAGKTDTALSLVASSIPFAREAGDTYRLAQMLFVWAHVLGSEDGRETEAIALLEEVLPLVHGKVLASELHPSALHDLGNLRLRKGDREGGVALIVEALGMYRTTANQFGIGQTLQSLGHLDRDDGDTSGAARHYSEALRAYRDSGIMTQIGFLLTALAALAADAGFSEASTRIAGMVQAIADRTGAVFGAASPARPASGRQHAPPVNHPTPFDAGRELAFDQALTEAIAIADALAAGDPPPGGARHRPPPAPARLSPRERHVLSLLAQRYTAPEIADQLFLSVRTVERHVSNVYDKLGVSSRRAAVDAATNYGLV